MMRWWKQGWFDMVKLFAIAGAIVFIGYLVVADIYESIQKDRVERAERARRHQEALKSLDEIGRSMEKMAATTQRLLKEETERLEAESERLEKRNQTLRAAIERAEVATASEE